MVYIPRGYITITQALDQLFEARHPVLAISALAREDERSSLIELERLSNPSPRPILPPDYHATEGKKIEFTPEHRERLQVLADLQRQTADLHDECAAVLRGALAENDLTAISLMPDGRQQSIDAASWRADDGLEMVKSGRIRATMVPGFGTDFGELAVREIDVITWLSVNFPRSFSEISIAVAILAQQKLKQGTPDSITRSVVVPATPPPLPLWLTPMETIAWIVIRDARIVLNASPKRAALRGFIINHKLPNGKRVSGEVNLPTGISFMWLDHFAAVEGRNTEYTTQAMEELLTALETGELIGKAIWVATGERKDIDPSEWRGMELESPPESHRMLILYEKRTGDFAETPVKRWQDALFPSRTLLEIWPAFDPALTTSEPRAAARTEAPIMSQSSGDAPRQLARGRRPKYRWTKILTGLGARLHIDGIPEPGDGGLAVRPLDRYRPGQDSARSSGEGAQPEQSRAVLSDRTGAGR